MLIPQGADFGSCEEWNAVGISASQKVDISTVALSYESEPRREKISLKKSKDETARPCFSKEFGRFFMQPHPCNLNSALCSGCPTG